MTFAVFLPPSALAAVLVLGLRKLAGTSLVRWQKI
jgi:hypothetical protein